PVDHRLHRLADGPQVVVYARTEQLLESARELSGDALSVAKDEKQTHDREQQFRHVAADLADDVRDLLERAVGELAQLGAEGMRILGSPRGELAQLLAEPGQLQQRRRQLQAAGE